MKLATLISASFAALASALALETRPGKSRCDKECPAGSGTSCVIYQGEQMCVGMCGGFAGFRCASEYDACVDDPRDSCFPEEGGADCSGICVPK